MNTKLGAKFWLNLFFGFFGGLSAGFAACLLLGGFKNVLISLALGLAAGLISGYGILFLCPKDNASDGAIGRYAFWPMLVPGVSLAESLHMAHPMALMASGIAGFLVALMLHFRKEFFAKNAK